MVSNDLYWIRAYFQVITLNHFDPFQIIFCFPNTTINWPSCNQQGTWNVKCHEKDQKCGSLKSIPCFQQFFSDDVFETLYDENWSSCRLDFWFDWNWGMNSVSNVLYISITMLEWMLLALNNYQTLKLFNFSKPLFTW